jgi:hypothetical protein
MRFSIVLFFMLSITTVQSQELDKLYYILGYEDDLSIPLDYERDLKSRKMAFWINESFMGKLYRFSEVTGFKFKKIKPEKGWVNLYQMYEFIGIPSFYKYGNFYDIKHVRDTTYYYGVGEVEVEKQVGFFKPSVLENVTELQMKSFLAGVYLEAGSIKGDTIKFEFHRAQNQKLTLIKDFIISIEKPKYLRVIHRQDEQDYCCGPTVVLMPNKVLLDVFLYEEERKKALFSSFNNSK